MYCGFHQGGWLWLSPSRGTLDARAIKDQPPFFDGKTFFPHVKELEMYPEIQPSVKRVV